jgi:hypothetical protein
MWVPDRMIGFLLAAHITACHSYSYSYIAIAIQHVQQSLHTTIHAVYVPQSSSLTPYSLNTHSLHSAITLCNHTMLLWPITFDSLNTSLLHCLNYTTLAAHYTCRSLTQSQIHSLDSAWLVHLYSPLALRADSPKTPLATSVLLSRHVPRHHPGISLVRWRPPSRKRSPTVAQSLLTSPAHAPYIITSPVNALTRRNRFHRTIASSYWGTT